MRHRTQFKNGENRYEVYFTYETYYGGMIYRSYDAMQRDEEIPNMETNHGSLVGWLHSHYWGTTERIDSLSLNRRPTISKIKRFISECYEVLAR